jgi:uncharacterized membrane protein
MPYIGKHSVYIVPTLGSINIREDTVDAEQFVLEAGEIAAIAVYISRRELADLIFTGWRSWRELHAVEASS